MGILPRGSGNGLARHLGISVVLTDAIDNLFNHKVMKIDTLSINDKLSLNVSGIGFDGHVANLFANKKIQRTCRVYPNYGKRVLPISGI